MLCFVFMSIIIKINHLYLLSISLSYTLRAFVPYKYVVIPSFCNLLSSLLFSAILLTYSVYTLCASLLNRCCDFGMISLLSNQFSLHIHMKSILFITIFFAPLVFLTLLPLHVK